MGEKGDSGHRGSCRGAGGRGTTMANDGRQAAELSGEASGHVRLGGGAGAGAGAYLLSLVEPLAVAVGQVHGPGHHARAGFELLQRRLHVSATGALCADARGERPGGTQAAATEVRAAGQVTAFCRSESPRTPALLHAACTTEA